MGPVVLVSLRRLTGTVRVQSRSNIFPLCFQLRHRESEGLSNLSIGAEVFF